MEGARPAQRPPGLEGKDTAPTAPPTLLQGLGEAPPGVQPGAIPEPRAAASINVEKYSTAVRLFCTAMPGNTQQDFDGEVPLRVLGAGGQPDCAHHAGNAGEGSWGAAQQEQAEGL